MQRRNVLPGLVAAVAALYPAGLTWFEQGIVAPFRFFAADAFYYLAVAARSQGRDVFTFDGRFATNGFHPLWQWGLAGVFAIADGARESQVLLAFASGAVLVALGAALFTSALATSLGRPGLALLAAVPGLYYVLMPPIAPHYFALWSFANGMESAVSVAAFGVLACALTAARLQRPQPPVRSLLGLGIAATVLTLARLDDVFVFPPLLLLAWAGSTSRGSAARRMTAVGLPPLLGIGAYLAYNAVSTGLLLPVSGLAKSEGSLAFARNGYATLTTLAPFVDLFGRGTAGWGSEAWRVLQMLVPAAAAILHLAARWRRRSRAGGALRDALREPLVVLSLYVLAKAAYNFAMVPLWHQGQWYFTVSILVASWIAADASARVLDRAGPASRPLRRASFALCAAFVLLYANAFAGQKRTGGLGLANHAFWQRGPEVDAALERVCPGCGVVEFDDGILSFSLARPVMSGLGLTLDREAFTALRQGALLSLAHARGFSLLATLHYAMPDEAYADPRALRDALEANVQLRGQALDRFDFRVVHTDAASGVRFVSFTPRAEGPLP